MATLATFDEALGDAVSRVRWKVGDTRTFQRDGHTVALVNDDTYQYWIDQGGESQAAIEILRGLITRYQHEPDSASLPDGTSASYSQRVALWRTTLAELTGRPGRRLVRLGASTETTEYTPR